MRVSSYIIEDILSKWGERDMRSALMEKFSQRYPSDLEFQSVFSNYEEVIKSHNTKKLETVKLRLTELEKLRKLSTGGGTRLMFKDRRHMGDDRSFR